MALLHLDFESEYMRSNQDVYIIVPDRPKLTPPAEFYGEKRRYPVLWLLHGTFGGYSDWLRKSNIELYTAKKEMIVVMPGIGNADYEAWDNFTLGIDSEKYITDELMPLVHSWLPASDRREDNFVAGLSMGGGGALKLALLHPELFEAAAVLSYAPADMETQKAELEELFGADRDELLALNDMWHSKIRSYNRMHRYSSVDEYLASPANTWRLLEESAGRKELPRLLFTCGSEDPLMTENFRALKKHFEESGREAEWSEGPGGHSWPVWDRDIQKALEFFGLNK